MTNFYRAALFLFAVCSLQCIGSAQEESLLKRSGRTLEWVFRCNKELPQYTYIARPMYRAAGGADRPLLSVPIAFVTTDLLVHRALPHAVLCSCSKTSRDVFLFDPKLYVKDVVRSPVGNGLSLVWASLSIPIAWHKYKERTT